eukprot:scaffold97393_cov72-Phaeocystis_antarctica.AAC.1
MVSKNLECAAVERPNLGSISETRNASHFQQPSRPHSTGYGPKYSGARMQLPTRGPEADETKTMTVAWPHHACVPLSERRQHRPVRSTCADRYPTCAARHSAPT